MSQLKTSFTLLLLELRQGADGGSMNDLDHYLIPAKNKRILKKENGKKIHRCVATESTAAAWFEWVFLMVVHLILAF